MKDRYDEIAERVVSLPPERAKKAVARVLRDIDIDQTKMALRFLGWGLLIGSTLTSMLWWVAYR